MVKPGLAALSQRYGPAMGDAARVRPVFVVGCPRSGTSWIRNILGRHPEVHAGPESHLYPTIHGVVVSWGEHERRWAEVLTRFDGLSGHAGAGLHRWIDRARLVQLLDAAQLRPDPPLEVADDLVAAVVDHYATRRRLAAGTVLVEKTPDHIRWAERILERFPDARVVEVRRDGRDVCVSMERRARRVAWLPTDRRLQIDRWTDAIDLGLRLSVDPRFASRWLVVRYEDLTDAPNAEIDRLFAFTDVDASAALVDGIAAATHISRQRITGDGEHVRTGGVGDWRRYFDRSDIELFERHAGELSRRAGYEV